MIITKEKYQDFLLGQCAPAEEAAIAQYLQENPEELNALLDLQDWQNFNYNMRLLPAVSQILEHNIASAKQPAKRNWIRAVAAVAASIAITFTATKLAYRTEAPLTATITENRLIKIKNGADKESTTILPDGSTVIAQPGSTISFNESNKGNSRDVYLEQGTAYFAVKKDKHAPFNVHAGNTITTALGTAFTIINNREVKIQLHEGKVVVRTKSGTETFLSPGESLIINKEIKKETVKPGSTPKSKPVIVHESLDFHQTPLPEVLATLSNKFNTKIEYSNTENINITASFKSNENLESIIDIICTLNGLRSEKTTTGYIIRN